MRLLELEIQNFRGIRYVQLKPNGKNLVIWGPNGCGKSSVIDAIDFLLTGRISRLTGAGTGGISLAKHGPHIECNGSQAQVRAIVTLPGVEGTVTLQRCVDQPGTLTCIPAEAKVAFERIQTLARRGQHVLTRREILHYVTSEGGTRAQEIQELLNLTEVENIRKNLVKVSNNLAKEYKAAKTSVSQAEGNLCATLGIAKLNLKAALELVNQQRAVLGAGKTELLSPEQMKSGIQLPPARSGGQNINVTLIAADISNLKLAIQPGKRAELAHADQVLRQALAQLRANPNMQRALSLRQLTELGMSLLDESGRCPLCETAWPAGHLRVQFQTRLDSAEEASLIQQAIVTHSKELLTRGYGVKASLDKVIAVASAADLSEAASVLSRWRTPLTQWIALLEDPITDYPAPTAGLAEVESLFAEPAQPVEDLLDELLENIQDKYPSITPEQVAWDTLTRLEENLKALDGATQVQQQKKLFAERAQALEESFEQARDSILGQLYAKIQDRFTTLYRSLHGEDENAFVASLEPEGAALKFEVDFHGHGKHPPQALHSEGHQDSMGLCLYFALAERLTDGIIDLVLLDDVVMSVDSGHRRELCRVLKQDCQNRQFLITTHDRDWAAQLKSEGVVTSSSTVEFCNWSLNGGPRVVDEPDIWNAIAQDLDRTDVPSAAARLRRGSEQFYSEMCDRLQAEVRYHMSGRWELGELMSAANGRYRKLITKAKQAAQSWNNRAEMDRLSVLESVHGQIYSRTQLEQGIINANVHYNVWHSCSRRDFEPVVSAFHDLYDHFHCGHCNSVVYIVKNGMNEEAVKCACGAIQWNLVERKK